MTTYYVAKTGNNSNPGAIGSPRLTIASGITLLSPGDTLIVGDGTYAEAITVPSGSAGAYKTIRAANRGLALIRATAGNAVSGNGASYVELDGFDINTSAAGCHGVEIQSSHHVTIRNCLSHGNDNSGISLPWGEFFLVEGCAAYGNGRGGWYSGITLYQSRNITGDTTTAGPRNIIRNCIVYDNWTTGGSTDGNGILMDDWNHTQSYGPDPATWLGVRYPYGGLVENCIAYGNGNKGIGLAWVENIVVRNNTCYRNGIDGSQGTWRGDLSNQSGKNCTFANNIAVCDSSIAGTGSNNTAIGNYGTSTADGFTCSGTIWFNNLTYDLNNPGNSSLNIDGASAATPVSGNGNQLGVSPVFVNAAAANFRLQSGSPAINSGTATYGTPSADADGNPRVVGTIDIGAYEFGSSAMILNSTTAFYVGGTRRYKAYLGSTLLVDLTPAGISPVGYSNTTYASRTNTTVSATLSAGSIQNNDVMLLDIIVAASGATPSWTGLAGWTQIGSTISVNQSGFFIDHRTFIRVASGESGNYTFVHGTGSSQAAMTVWRGVNTTTPQDATSTGNSGLSNTSTWLGLTTATNGAVIVATGIDWGSTANNLSPPSGMTEIFEVNPLIYGAYEAVPSAGATGNRTHANNSNTNNSEPFTARLVALRPA